MPTITDLQAQAEPAKRRIEAHDRSRLAVCIDTSSIAVGAVEGDVARDPRGSFVEPTQRPAAGGSLEDGEGGVVLAEREQALEGEAEGPAQDRAVGAAVGHDGHARRRVSVGNRLERGPGAIAQVTDAFAVRERKLADARQPLCEAGRVDRLDLGGREPLPAAHRHLAQ